MTTLQATLTRAKSAEAEVPRWRQWAILIAEITDTYDAGLLISVEGILKIMPRSTGLPDLVYISS